MQRRETRGTTWERVEAPIWGRVNALTFVDTEHGWAAAEDWGADGDTPHGTILVTGDGGRTWAPQATSAAVLTSISMDASGSGWAFGAAGATLTTHDGGASWQAVTSGTDTAARPGWVLGPGRLAWDGATSPGSRRRRDSVAGLDAWAQRGGRCARPQRPSAAGSSASDSMRGSGTPAKRPPRSSRMARAAAGERALHIVLDVVVD